MRKGFSLLELMAVISMIAILITVAIPNYRDYIIRSEVVAGFSVINDYTQKMIASYNDKSLMPDSLEAYTYTTVGSYERAPIGANNIESVYHSNHASLPRADILFEYDAGLLPSDTNRRIYVAIACNSQDICRKFCGWENSTQENYIDMKYLPAKCKSQGARVLANTFSSQ